MIEYNPGSFAVGFIFRYHGSVFPRAFVWALLSAVIAFGSAHFRDSIDDVSYLNELKDGAETMRLLWTTFITTLGFLCVFRTQQAYGRYMEGALMLRQTRTEWTNAVTSLIAFSNREKKMRVQVERFQHFLVRLMSLLSCYTLQSMAETVDDCMPVINLSGLDDKCIQFLQSKPSYSQRSEIVKQWIQRFVVEQAEIGVIKVSPPILARFFQDFDHGAMCASQARNLTEIPFPFPYAQMMTVMLTVHVLFTPIVAGMLMGSETWGALLTFISVLAFWGTNYIACEIECPFGDDPNDLPLVNIQQDLNASFWILLEKQTQQVPTYRFDKEVGRKWRVDLVTDPELMTRRMSGRSSVSTKRDSLQATFNSSTGSQYSPPGAGGVGSGDKSTATKSRSLFASNHTIHSLVHGVSHLQGTSSTSLGAKLSKKNSGAFVPSNSIFSLISAKKELSMVDLTFDSDDDDDDDGTDDFDSHTNHKGIPSFSDDGDSHANHKGGASFSSRVGSQVGSSLHSHQSSQQTPSSPTNMLPLTQSQSTTFHASQSSSALQSPRTAAKIAVISHPCPADEIPLDRPWNLKCQTPR